MRGQDFKDLFPPDVQGQLPSALVDRLARFDGETAEIAARVERDAKDPALRRALLAERTAAHRAAVRDELRAMAEDAVRQLRIEHDNVIGHARLAARDDADPTKYPPVTLAVAGIEHATDPAALEADLADALLSEHGGTIRAVHRAVVARLEALDRQARQQTGFDPSSLTAPAETLARIRQRVAEWQHVDDADLRRRRAQMLQRPSDLIAGLEAERDRAVGRISDVFRMAADYVVTSAPERHAKRPERAPGEVEAAATAPSGGIVFGAAFHRS